MIASLHDYDSGPIRLFVAPHPRGKWDWRVWHTFYGAEHRYGVAGTAAAAVDEAERAAEEICAVSASPCARTAFETPGSVAESCAAERPPSGATLGSGRTFERVLVAFHVACDVLDVAVAKALLGILGGIIGQRVLPEDGRGRRNQEKFIAAHVRFWHLLHELAPKSWTGS